MNTKKLISPLIGLLMFIPLDIMAYQSDVKESSLRSLTYKECSGNHLRFKYIDGKLHINDEYLHPMQTEMQTLYYKALESTPTTITLAKELEKISKKDITVPTEDKATLYRYLYRYNFAHVARALEVKYLLNKFIKQNNLFGI